MKMIKRIQDEMLEG